MIKPTVGRIVHYTPGIGDDIFQMEQPLGAMIAYVWSDRMVNLTVSDANGETHGRISVTLLQDGDEAPTASSYCQWMDYQLGQAAKAEALQKQMSDQASVTAPAQLAETPAAADIPALAASAEDGQQSMTAA